MDPSADLCLIYDSLKVTPPLVTTSFEWYTEKHNLTLSANYVPISITSYPLPKYALDKDYQNLQRAKDSFNTDGFIQARNAMNPFEEIGTSIFTMNRAGVKLGNIDAVHHVTNEIFNFENKTSNKPFTFCDVAAGPGGFTHYLQYRFPNSKGYGMTLKHETLDWNTKFIDTSKFTISYGKDNTGNLYTNWESFIHLVLSKEPGGVDLVTADGGFEVEDYNNPSLIHHVEFLSSRLLLTQSLIGIGCAKLGGNFVLKVFDTVTELSGQILFVLSQCFEKILIFKPVTSRPANAERYLICINRQAKIQEFYQLLSGAANTYKDEIYLDRIFSEALPELFVTWLNNQNNISIQRQAQAALNILLYLKGTPPSIPRYDIDKFLIIWNLPDTPINPRKTFIKI